MSKIEALQGGTSVQLSGFRSDGAVSAAKDKLLGRPVGSGLLEFKANNGLILIGAKGSSRLAQERQLEQLKAKYNELLGTRSWSTGSTDMHDWQRDTLISMQIARLDQEMNALKNAINGLYL